MDDLAANILARECQFVFDLRCIPDRDPEAVLQRFWAAVKESASRLEAYGDGIGIAVTRLAAVPSLRPETGGVAETLSAMLSGGDGSGSAVPYSAEAGQFQRAGLSTVICGPGSIVQAHRADEFIEVSQMAAGARFVNKLVNFVRAQ